VRFANYHVFTALFLPVTASSAPGGTDYQKQNAPGKLIDKPGAVHSLFKI